MASARFIPLLQEYADLHRHPTNQLTHTISSPLLVFHVVAMADWVKLAPLGSTGLYLTLAHVGFLAAIAWYLSLNVKSGLAMALLALVCFPLGWITPPWLVVAIAFIAWVLTFGGHAIWEKSGPKFPRSMLQPLLAPFFLVSSVIGEWPPRAAT